MTLTRNNRKLKKKKTKSRISNSKLKVSSSSKSQDNTFHKYKIVKLIIGICVLPLCFIITNSLFKLFNIFFNNDSFFKSSEFLYFVVGGILSISIFLFFRIKFFIYIYVLGHELTHYIFSIFHSGKVSDFKVTAKGGYVVTDKNNTLISLSPYIFPFYTAVLIILYKLIQWVFEAKLIIPINVIYCLVGFTWMFHFCFTLWIILRKQPDIDQNGKLFSFTIIFLINILSICLFLIIISDAISFNYFIDSIKNSIVNIVKSFKSR